MLINSGLYSLHSITAKLLLCSPATLTNTFACPKYKITCPYIPNNKNNLFVKYSREFTLIYPPYPKIALSQEHMQISSFFVGEHVNKYIFLSKNATNMASF